MEISPIVSPTGVGMTCRVSTFLCQIDMDVQRNLGATRTSVDPGTIVKVRREPGEITGIDAVGAAILGGRAVEVDVPERLLAMRRDADDGHDRADRCESPERPGQHRAQDN
jgi:hypothetical protein